MGVSRTLKLRIASPFESFSKLLHSFLGNGFSQNQDGTLTSVAFGDDLFNYEAHDYQESLEILDRREAEGKENSVVIWDDGFTESFDLLITKLEGGYQGFRSHFTLQVGIGIGKRIRGAERYTDYGYYLSEFVPRLINLGCAICEIECHDFDY